MYGTGTGFKKVKNADESRLLWKALGIGGVFGFAAFLGVSIYNNSLTGINYAFFNLTNFAIFAFFIWFGMMAVEFAVYKRIELVENILGALLMPVFLFFAAAVAQIMLLATPIALIVDVIMTILAFYLAFNLRYAIREKLGI